MHVLTSCFCCATAVYGGLCCACVCCPPLQHLKHRVSQLEGAGQQVEALRRDNAMLTQHMMEMEAAVSVWSGRWGA